MIEAQIQPPPSFREIKLDFDLSVCKNTRKTRGREPITQIQSDYLSCAQNGGASDAQGTRCLSMSSNGFQGIQRNTERLEIAYSAVEGHARHSNLHNVGRFSWFMKSFGTSKAPQRKIFHTDLDSASSCEKANFWRRTTQTDIWGQRGPGKAFFNPFEGLQNIWTVFFWLFRLIIGATDIKCVWEIF